MLDFSFYAYAGQGVYENQRKVIKEPCSICRGECHKFDRIQCDECDKWVHLSCTTLTHEEFIKLGKSSKPFFCKNKCKMKLFPFSRLSNNNLSSENERVLEIQMREVLQNCEPEKNEIFTFQDL